MTVLRQGITKTIPPLGQAGIDHLVASNELGVGVQTSALVTLTGANQAILFANLKSNTGGEFKPPLDTDYIVLVTGKSTAQMDFTVARTTNGFTLSGGANTDQVSFVVWSRFGRMLR